MSTKISMVQIMVLSKYDRYNVKYKMEISFQIYNTSDNSKVLDTYFKYDIETDILWIES